MMTSYLHHDSPDCAISELDLFSIPPTNTQVDSGSFVTYQPVASITENGPLEFFISASGDEYLHLAETLLHIQGTLHAPDKTGPVNLPLHSLFSQVDVYFNDRLITTSNNAYPYRCYMETLLNYGGEAKTSQLTSELFYKDTAGAMDDVADANDGLVKRRKQGIDLIGRPHVDLFHQDKYLVNNVDVKIRFIRAKPSFYLMSGANGDHKITIESAVLYVRKVKISPSVALAHASVLSKGITMKMPFNRVDMKTFTVSAGLSSVSRENIVIGQLPERIILGFVDAEAFNGSYKLNPFNFAHQNLSYLSLHANSQQLPPYEMDFDKNRYVRAYHSLFSALDKAERDSGNQISREDFKNGYALYAFDLTPDLKAGGPNFSLVRQGNVRVEARFNKPLERAITCILLMEYESLLEIDADRNIHFDYSV